jgi:hypothetical protein
VRDVAHVTAPNRLVSGWFDFMLPQLLRDSTVQKYDHRVLVFSISLYRSGCSGSFLISIYLWVLRAGLFELGIPLFPPHARQTRAIMFFAAVIAWVIGQASRHGEMGPRSWRRGGSGAPGALAGWQI